MAPFVSQKLDFLMKLVDVPNNALGKAVSFDASYISRIRAGRRNLPTHKSFIEPASAFLARHITETYQKDVMAKLTSCGAQWPEDMGQAAACIAAWLRSSADEKAVSQSVPDTGALPRAFGAENAVRFFYGNDGKRQAVIAFLSALLREHGAPPPLLLASDEDMSWMYEKKSFAREWASLLGAYIQKGGRIKIVHTIKRDIGEMMEAVKKWLPFYATGAIEPYHCTRLRDYIFRRSLFVAAGHSAVVSNSIESRVDGMANLLIVDAQAAIALEREFNNYLTLCQPLLSVFTPKNSDAFHHPLERLMKKDAGVIIRHKLPLWGLLPKASAQKIARRLDCPLFAKTCEKMHRRLLDFFSTGQSVTEILRLPPPEMVKADGVVLTLTDLLAMPELRLNAGETADLVCAAAACMERRPNYRIVFEQEDAPIMSIVAKENGGTLLFSPQPPSVALYAGTIGISEAFYEYLGKMAAAGSDRKEVLKELRRYEEILRQGMPRPRT